MSFCRWNKDPHFFKFIKKKKKTDHDAKLYSNTLWRQVYTEGNVVADAVLVTDEQWWHASQGIGPRGPQSVWEAGEDQVTDPGQQRGMKAQ